MMAKLNIIIIIIIIIAIGPQSLVQEEVYNKTCTSIKILGIYFHYHETTRRNSNFNSILKSIKETWFATNL